jgi:hypothetical protein
MRYLAASILVLSLGAGVAEAQTPAPRWYGGASIGASRITADEVDGTIATAVGIVGVRLTRAFGLEGEIGRGLSPYTRSYEAPAESFAAPGSPYEGIVNQAVHRRWHHEWTPKLNAAVLAVWRPRQTGRVQFTAFGGVTIVRYDEHTHTDVTALPEVVPVPPDHPSVLPTDEIRTRTRGGFTGGVSFPVTLGAQVSVAPELRYSYGSMGDERHDLLRAGVRVLWGF